MEEDKPLLDKKTQCSNRTSLLVYLSMVLFGVASLLPWNMVITATGYFAVKFSATNSTTIATSYPTYFQIGGIGSNVLLSLSSVALVKRLPVKPLMLICNGIALSIFFAMTVTSKLQTDSWAYGFFYFSNATFCVACAVSAVYISGMMATASMLTSNAIKGFYLGQGAAGLFATVISIITLSIPGADPVHAGFYYFLIATLSLSLSFAAYIVFSSSEYVKESTARKEESVEDGDVTKDLSPWLVFTKIWKYCLTSLITLLITLACFPAALSSLRPVHSEDNKWNNTYFLPVMTFLLFNIGDVLGRITSSCFSYPNKNLILPAAISRLVFIPLIYMCNLQPRALPIWFASDAWPAVFNILLSWTNGHLLSLSAAYGPQEVQSKGEKSLTGSFSAGASAVGLVVGSILVFPFLKILQA